MSISGIALAPLFSAETAHLKVKAAQDMCNTQSVFWTFLNFRPIDAKTQVRDPQKIKNGYTAAASGVTAM